MCTAAAFRANALYFGRTLDNEVDFGEEVTITPRNFPLHFRHQGIIQSHYAIIGMALVLEDYPLYFDAVNEAGLAMAGLNFLGNAHYSKPESGKDNIAQYELIPWVLSQCASVRQAKKLLGRINITDDGFSASLSPALLHWIIADDRESITVEAVKDGLRVHGNPVGVLTNDPAFELQLFNLNHYQHVTAQPAENRFSSQVPMRSYSRGMGGIGLPGDLSSMSRFVRAAFVNMNSTVSEDELENISQFFHILGAVDQQKGCAQVPPEHYEMTMYTSCCNTAQGVYYYSTYYNHQISAVDMHREALDSAALIRYGLNRKEQVHYHN